jgi:hypothetical protein
MDSKKWDKKTSIHLARNQSWTVVNTHKLSTKSGNFLGYLSAYWLPTDWRKELVMKVIISHIKIYTL